MSRLLSALVLAISPMVGASLVANAADAFVCEVQKKVDSERSYAQENIARWQYSVRIIDNGSSFVMKRCSYEILANAMTCDEYDGDHKAIDENINARKYYYFRGQFDVQIFSDGSFVENSGRGEIAFGQCRQL